MIITNGTKKTGVYVTTPPAIAPVPKLAAKDSRWLQNLPVAWKQEPEPEFVPPKTLPEYLARFPNGIRAAASVLARGERHSRD